ncbi:uncharacterized protein PAC_06122 [Phialocephala subalpina]|uniref:NAD-dependent epimerase/dehydratase domain-containing protein n=1 Tax=Phialocephala subalpina TaxID=576137 RepID=A0A1L7WTX8_9HELO|nr:uncharacterized protein PAC_06122 [Phialocephala subalpina]
MASLSPSEALVLVTGGSGFLGTYCIIALLNAGYQVRTTIRSLTKSSFITTSLKTGGISDASLKNLSFIAADLTKDEGWPKAAEGCTYILHVASPFPANLPKHEDDLIIPAREGTLRVLRAAKISGVKRVVVTSSFAAVAYGHPAQSSPFTEESWTDTLSLDVTPYEKSKTVAERAAWDYVNSPEGEGLELSVINPVGIFGPVLSSDFSTSIILIQRQLNGDLAGCPRLVFGIVDVRDCASPHLLAMTHPKAAGERFIGISGKAMSVQEIAFCLKERMPNEARRTKTRILPDWLVRFIALFDGEVRSVAPMIGKRIDGSGEKAKKVLRWEPRSREDAVVATGESLVRLGLLKK